MNLTVNGRFLGQRVTGVERYAREVLTRHPGRASVVSPRGAGRGLRGHLWEQSVLPTRLSGGMLWSPCNTGPLAVSRQVVTIHDCAFYDQPEGFSRKFAAWYQFLVPKLARRIARIITISQFSCDRLLDYCCVPREKIVVIPNGVDRHFRPLATEVIADARASLGLPSRYVLFVGNLAPRKNLLRLLEAWQLVRPRFRETSLVLAGAANHVFRDAGFSSPPPGVQTVGYVDDAHLPALYCGAECFAFPSLYEGFGLPVLEAMACGVPVLASNVTSLPEVAGDAALLVDPYSVDDIAEGLERLLTDTALRKELSQRGLARAATFTWDRTAAVTWQLLADEASA